MTFADASIIAFLGALSLFGVVLVVSAIRDAQNRPPWEDGGDLYGLPQESLCRVYVMPITTGDASAVSEGLESPVAGLSDSIERGTAANGVVLRTTNRTRLRAAG